MNSSRLALKVIYDGNCNFCKHSVAQLKAMDWCGRLTFEPRFEEMKELQVIDQEYVYGGFDGFRRLCLVLPPLFPFVLIVFLPGVSIVGRAVYRFIARRRYLGQSSQSCDRQCKI